MCLVDVTIPTMWGQVHQALNPSLTTGLAYLDGLISCNFDFSICKLGRSRDKTWVYKVHSLVQRPATVGRVTCFINQGVFTGIKRESPRVWATQGIPGQASPSTLVRPLHSICFHEAFLDFLHASQEVGNAAPELVSFCVLFPCLPSSLDNLSLLQAKGVSTGVPCATWPLLPTESY